MAVSFTIFKSGTNDRQVQLMFQFGAVAHAPGVLIATARSSPVEAGRFGTNMAIDFPPIADGNGSIVALSFSLRRRAHGDGVSGIVRAGCPDGHLDFRTTAVLVDGTRASDSSVRACATAS